MCLGRELLAAVCFGLVPLGAKLLVLLTTGCRIHLSYDLKACAKILGKSLWFTIPVAAAILVARSWFDKGDEAMVCLDRGTFVAGAFALSTLLAFVTVGFEQVKTASGVNVSGRYRGRFMLFLLVLAFAFYFARMSIRFLWR